MVIDNLPFILPENKLDEIAVTLALQDYDRLEEIVNLCEKSGVHTKFIPDYNSLIRASLIRRILADCRSSTSVMSR